MKTILVIILQCALPALLFSQVHVSTLVEEIDASGGVKVNASGELFVADFGESLDNANGTNVHRITPDGQVMLFASGLSGASGNDFDSQGNLFQSSIGAGTVSKITPEGDVSTFVSAGISCNVGIAIDAEDNLYVCNCCGANGNTIRKVSPEGTSTLFASGNNIFSCPNGITFDGDGNLYVSNFSNGHIVKILPDGSPSIFATTPGTFNSAASNGHITYSPIENVLYVASHGSHRIYRLDLEGNLEVFAGTSERGNQDGPALEATFSRPNGLAVSLSGDTLFVNSSIPVTNAGGRPLNPSKIRMITGLLSPTNTNNLTDRSIAVGVSPNLTNNDFRLDVSMDEPEPLTALLIDQLGRLHRTLLDQQTISGEQTFYFSFEESDAKGLYYLFLESQGRTKVEKIIYQ